MSEQLNNTRNALMEELYLCLMDRLGQETLAKSQANLESLLQHVPNLNCEYQRDGELQTYKLSTLEGTVLEISLYALDNTTCHISLGFENDSPLIKDQLSLANDLIKLIDKHY